MTNCNPTPMLRSSARIVASIAFLLIGTVVVVQAQWTTPDASQNINNTNSGNVGVGTTTPATKLDIAGVTRAQAFNLSGLAAEKVFSVVWNNGVANQKVQLYWPANSQVDGIFEITVTGHFWFSNSNGGIKKRIVINGRNVGIINMQQSEVPFRLGFTGNINTISNIMWDATNSRYYFIVANLDNAQNAITIHVKSITPGPITATADNLNITPIYTTDTTSYPQLFTSFMSGNVGVGTNTPGYKLDVQGGQINSSGGLCIAGDCKTAWSQVGGGGGSQWTTSGSTIYYNSGNVGIGLTSAPTRRLEVLGGNVFHQWSTNAGTEFGFYTGINNNHFTSNLYYDGQWKMITAGKGAFVSAAPQSGFAFNVAADNTSRSANAAAVPIQVFAITMGGNVGIGTGTPATKLDVAGIVRSGNADTNLGNHSTYGTTYSAFWRQGADYSLLTNGTHTYLNAPLTSGNIYFRAANSDKMFIQGSNGNVGIGTVSPTTKLHVVGDVTVTGNIAAKYQDIAEWVESAAPISSGTVVVLDSSSSNRVTASSCAYDTRVAGVVSAQPGLTLGEAGDNKVLVATTGRVKVKVDASNGPIGVGDLLVTSDREGFAMKSLSVDIGGIRIHRPGTLIGKALEPLAQGKGEILVLLSLQ